MKPFRKEAFRLFEKEIALCIIGIQRPNPDPVGVFRNNKLTDKSVDLNKGTQRNNDFLWILFKPCVFIYFYPSVFPFIKSAVIIIFKNIHQRIESIFDTDIYSS